MATCRWKICPDMTAICSCAGPSDLKKNRCSCSCVAMAIMTAKAPGKPEGLEVKVRADKSLEIRWQADGSKGHFHLEIRYFDFEGPGIEADHLLELEVVNKCAVKVVHPKELPLNKAWVVKVALKASENDMLSDAVEKQVAWDDELSEEETKKDLAKCVSRFQKNDLEPFAQAKGIPKILVVAAQHHGKSSHLNHLFRCFNGDLNLNDQMDVAPAGKEEKTMSMKSLELPVGSSHMVLVDTPAFPNMNAEMQQKLKTLLSTGVEDGVGRQELAPGRQSSLKKPPHGAIIIVSLCHWRDQQEEMQVYLQKMAEAFKNASSRQVAFPYVVALTFRDEYLKDCQKETPREELENAVAGIQKASLTDHVYSITNYKRGALGSARNNQETFDLLSQLLTKASRVDTATAAQKIVAPSWSLLNFVDWLCFIAGRPFIALGGFAFLCFGRVASWWG